MMKKLAIRRNSLPDGGLARLKVIDMNQLTKYHEALRNSPPSGLPEHLRDNGRIQKLLYLANAWFPRLEKRQ